VAGSQHAPGSLNSWYQISQPVQTAPGESGAAISASTTCWSERDRPGPLSPVGVVHPGRARVEPRVEEILLRRLPQVVVGQENEDPFADFVRWI